MKIKLLTILFLIPCITWAQTTLINYKFESPGASGSFAAYANNAAAGITASVNSNEAYDTSRATGVVTTATAFSSNTPAGQALLITNATATDPKVVDFFIGGNNLNLYQDFKVYFQARRTSTGFKIATLSYSTDSITFTPFDTLDLTAISATWVARNFDLTAITALNGQTKVFFRLSVNKADATSAAGTIRFDNFQVQANCIQMTEPTLDAANVSINNISCSNADISLDKGNGLKRLIIIKAGSSVTGSPADGQLYNANTVFGSGSTIAAGEFAIYSDTGNAITITGLTVNTTYFVKVFEYNINAINCDQSTNYLNAISETSFITPVATEPTIQASSITADTLYCNRLTLRLTKGNGTNRIVVARLNAAVTAIPTDMIDYTANSTFGSGTAISAGQFVVYNGTDSVINVTGLNDKSTYYFTVFEYNVPSGGCVNAADYESIGASTNLTTTYCFEVERLLVDACVPGSGCTSAASPNCSCEGKNEMVLFHTGNTPIHISQVEIVWPNASNSYLGLVQDAASASLTNTLDTTVKTTCGQIVEPANGWLPLNTDILLITSTDMCTSANSFANLNYTLYVIYQNAGNYQGHFVNYSSTPGIRTMIFGLDDGSGGIICADTVSYDKSLLSNADGAAVEYDIAGSATYVNIGCNAPFNPFTVTPSIQTVKANNVLCTGDTLILQANPSIDSFNSLQWTGGNGGSFNTPAANVDSVFYIATAADVGTISFNLSIISSCNDTLDSTITITVVRPASAQITPDGPTVFCQGNDVILQANTGTGYSYSWSPGNETTSSITINTPGTYTLSVTNVCGTSTDDTVIVVNPLPDISISPTGTFNLCPGQDVQFTATMVSGTSYTWSTGETAATITVSQSDTIYAYAVDETNGCLNDTSVNVIVIANTLPPADAGPDVQICNTSSGTTIGTAGAIGNSYTWTSDPAGFSSSNAQESVNPAATTTYYLEVNSGAGCTSLDTVIVDVVSAVVASINISSTPSDAVICEGQTISFSSTANGGGMAAHYQWLINGTPQTNDTLSTFNPALLNNSDTVSCVYTSSLSCASGSPASSNVIAVTINPNPVVSLINDTICSGDTASLNASGAASYSWATNSTILTTNNNIITSNPIALTSYTVYGESNNCFDTASASVVVNNLPAFTVNSASICSGSNTTLTASDASLIYSWLPAATLSSDTGISVLSAPADTTTYQITGTDTNGCVSQTTSTVTVVPLPIVTSSDVTVCQGGTVNLNANGADTYIWSPSTYLNTTISGSVIASNVSGAITYSITGTKDGCEGTAAASITLTPGPIVTVSDITICSGQAATLTATGSAATTYTWTSDPTITTGLNNGTIEISTTATNTYTVMADSAGCTTTTTAQVIVNSLPSFTVNPNPVFICQGESTTLTASDGTLTYIWSPSAGLSATSGTSVNANPGNTTTYQVTGSNSNCSLTLTVPVTVTPVPVVTVTTPNSSICLGGNAAMNASSSVGSPSFAWSPSTFLSSTTSNSVTASNVSQTITYTVIATDNGCMDTAITTITVTPPPSVTITGDTVICNGKSVILTASGTGPYSWNTGETTASITVAPILNTTYTAFASDPTCGFVQGSQTVYPETTDAGFTSSVDTGYIPLDIQFLNTSSGSGSISYNWDYNGPTGSQMPPLVTYTDAGIYHVILTATGALGCKDTAGKYIRAIEPVVKIEFPNIFTPNGDGSNDNFKPVSLVGITEMDLTIYTRWGQVIYKTDGVNGSWDGKTSSGTSASDGVYYFIAIVKTLSKSEPEVKIENYITLIR